MQYVDIKRLIKPLSNPVKAVTGVFHKRYRVNDVESKAGQAAKALSPSRTWFRVIFYRSYTGKRVKNLRRSFPRPSL